MVLVYFHKHPWNCILCNPGAVSQAGRKGTTKVFKHGWKSPWVPTLIGPFPNGQANAGSWLGTKFNFELLCSIDEQFSWVLFMSSNTTAISRHSCPVPSPCFPNQKRGDYWWVEKRFGCYQQEQFNLHWENSVSDGSQCIVNNRICWNFAITEAIMAGTNSLKWFLKKTPGTEKHKDKIKNVMALLRCHCDSDCNKTQIIRNFHLYVIQLWEPFFHIFTHGIVTNAQIWEVSPPKNSSGATLRTQRLKFGI